MNKKQVIWIVAAVIASLLIIGVVLAVIIGLGAGIGAFGSTEPTEMEGLVDFDNMDLDTTQPQLNATDRDLEPTQPAVLPSDPEDAEDPIIDESDATKPSYESTEPEENPMAPDEPDNTQPEEKDITYAEYLRMSNADKQKFKESFSDTQAFLAWLEAAKAAHNGDTSTEIGGGNIIIP